MLTFAASGLALKLSITKPQGTSLQTTIKGRSAKTLAKAFTHHQLLPQQHCDRSHLFFFRVLQSHDSVGDDWSHNQSELGSIRFVGGCTSLRRCWALAEVTSSERDVPHAVALFMCRQKDSKQRVAHSRMRPNAWLRCLSPAPNFLRHAATCNRVTVKHVFSSALQLRDMCFVIRPRAAPEALRAVLLTTFQASEPHASTFHLPFTIVLPRRQPNLHPCSSRFVMGRFGTDSSSQSRDDQPSTLSPISKSVVAAHWLSPFAIPLLS